MTAPRLPLHVRAWPDEPLASYLDRCAALRPIALGAFLRHLGIYDGKRSSLAAYGVRLSREHIRAVAARCGLSESVVEQMLVERLPVVPRQLSSTAVKQLPSACWIYTGDSHFCPQCLGERDGAWRLAWRLPWTYACVQHRVLLHDACPRCGQRRGYARNRELKPRLGQIPTPTHCSGIRPDGALCGCPLHEVPSLDLSPWPPLLEAQDDINAGLDRRRSVFAGESLPTATWFAEVRSACALVMHAIANDDLIAHPQNVSRSLPVAVREALERHIAMRDAPPAHRGRGTRNRFYTTVPRRTSLIAGVLPWALHSSAGDDSELRVRVSPLARRLADRRLGGVSLIGARYGLTTRLTGAIEAHVRRVVHRGPFDAARRYAGIEHAALRFEARHVPPLIFPDVWTDALRAALMNGVEPLPGFAASPRTVSARRFCSLALIRVCFASSWREAGRILGLDSATSTRISNGWMHRLIERRSLPAFIANLGSLARDIGRRRPLIDWQRRRHVANAANWPTHLQTAGYPHTARTRRCGTAYAWSQVACADPFTAPVWGPGPTAAQRESYWQFVTQHPRARERLDTLLQSKWPPGVRL